MRQYPKAWLQGASFGESIACQLRLQIIDGTIKAGEVISENKVAADFGMSRSPVRDALKTLSNEGLIRLERMGAIVLGMSLGDVEELYDVRYLIESFAQQRIAGEDNAKLLALLRQTIDKMELAVKHQDAETFSYLDFSFHEAIVKEAKHRRVQHLWNSIRQIVLTVMLITTEEVFSEGEARILSVIDKHRTILRALETRDVGVIGQVVREYFADSRVTLHISFQ
ncbi:FCD domain-containing protein [Cohnella sp. CFH 77786]|uniref:GntR family transcriptional regulator n=1 Tax=Cohnella sp. CFH 77786 TaxID=2662265 RepID=UPI001C609BC9|nr:GntR family transcriptional regulator [Cohnella sp. CFH 77786]MBW5448591.1 FCD domain-containing protein [Cohnella sp. CFH 77786]